MRAWLSRLPLLPILLALMLLAAGVHFLWFVGKSYPVQTWLFWRYAMYWVICAVWSTACLSPGHVIVRWLVGRNLPILEHVSLSMAVGVLVFFLAMFLTGLAGWYGTVLFFALPLALLVCGGRSMYRYGRRAARHVRHSARRSPAAPAWTYVVFAFGLAGLAMVYFLILTPANISFDARFKHLAIAEHYVAIGGVAPFVEGWLPGTAPHLPSFLYAWAFMIPSDDLFDRLELCAHLEFTVFLFTLFAIPALVRRVVPQASGRFTWTTRFLFPGVFLYDSNLNCGSDHIASIFAGPLFLMVLRAWRDLSPRRCAALALCAAGAALSKYSSAIAILAFPAVAVGLRAMMLAWRAFRTRDQVRRTGAHYLLGPGVALLTGLVSTAPHWLKNLLWYGDPLYPQLHQFFRGRPLLPDNLNAFSNGLLEQFWRPPHTLAGVWEALSATLTFSYVPHAWAPFHGKVPVFGSMLTIALLCLPFVRARPRLWALFGCVHMGIFSWYWVHHEDRHLQTMMPLMAAASAGVLILMWRSARMVRPLVAGVVTSQLIWGADVYFFPGHAMIDGSPIHKVVDLMSSGYRKDPKGRLDTFKVMDDIARALPPDAKVLLHGFRLHTGLGAASVSDINGWQGAISYGVLNSRADVHHLLDGMGVTHLVWEPSSISWDTLAGEVRFFDYALHTGTTPRLVAGDMLVPVPDSPPREAGSDLVAFLGCGDAFDSGLYRLTQLRVPPMGPKSRSFPKPFTPLAAGPNGAQNVIDKAMAVVVQKGCAAAMPGNRAERFTRATTFRRTGLHGPGAGKTKFEIWVRKDWSQGGPRRG